ncbi:exonuclease domain-containing protein, partial [Vibrio breoganii]
MNRLVRYYWHHKLKGSAYQPLFTTPTHNEYISLDCETTSLDPNQAELVTIAATKIIGNRIITSQPFEVQLRAPQSLDCNSIKIHRIRHQDLKHGIEEKQALIELLDFIG